MVLPGLEHRKSWHVCLHATLSAEKASLSKGCVQWVVFDGKTNIITFCAAAF